MQKKEEPEKSRFLEIAENIRLKSLESDLEHQMYKRELIQREEIAALKVNAEEREMAELGSLQIPELYSVMDFEHQRLKMNLHVVQTRMQAIKPNLIYNLAIPGYTILLGGILVYIAIFFQGKIMQPLGEIAISTSVSIFVGCVLYAFQAFGGARNRKLEFQFLKEKAVEAEDFIVYLEREISEVSGDEFRIAAG